VQLASIAIQTALGSINLGAVYCPPGFPWTTDEFECILDENCPKYIIAGDWNASHWLWGAGRCNQRGRALANLALSTEVSCLATGGPTRYPFGSRGSPGYIDFAITRGILGIHAEIRSVAELSSDHLPLIITLDAAAVFYPRAERIITRRTNVDVFHSQLEQSLHLNMEINSGRDIEDAIDLFTNKVKSAAKMA
ncbi:hypothetical protein KR018_008976, partial [Drosophila ironensis]